MPGQAGVAGPGEPLALLLRSEAREHRILGRARLVEGDADAVAGAGEGAGALNHFAEHGVEIEGGVDAPKGRDEGGDVLARRPALSPCVVELRQGCSLFDSARIAACPGAEIAVPRAVCGMAQGKLVHTLLKRHQKTLIHT